VERRAQNFAFHDGSPQYCFIAVSWWAFRSRTASPQTFSIALACASSCCRMASCCCRCISSTFTVRRWPGPAPGISNVPTSHSPPTFLPRIFISISPWLFERIVILPV
jgi:hypothetical protein